MKTNNENIKKNSGSYENRKLGGFVDSNLDLVNLEEIKKAYGEAPWEHPLVRTDLIWVSIHCMPPGMQTRAEYHDNTDECWKVLEGEIEWEIEGLGKILTKPDDFVLCKQGHAHRIKTVSDKNSIRLAFILPFPDQSSADISRLKVSKE